MAKHKKRNAFDSMAWSADPLVREIHSQIDDRELDEIAESVYELYFGSEEDWGDDDRDPMRSFQEPEATSRLTKDEAEDATVLASQIVDWANYAIAYGDYDSPPWEREDNPKPAPVQGKKAKSLKSRLLR